MNKNMKRTINLTIIMIVAIIAFLAIKSIPTFLRKNVAIEKTENVEVLGLAPGSAFVADESTVIGFDPIHFEVSGISQIYCAQKGGHVSLKGEYYEDLLADIEAHKNDKAKCMKHVAIESRKPLKSKIYYSVDGTREATPEEAYIVTYPAPGVNDWSEEKQYAMWGSSMSNNSATPPTSETSDKILAEAAKYGEFNPDQMSQMANPTGSGNNVKVSVAQNPKEYIVGPFTMNYGNGQYDNITFGGVSKAYIDAESGQIEIKSFIIGGTEITPRYFTPDGTEMVDRNPQAYPKSGEEFYVKFVSDKEEHVNNIHFDFQWMEATATLTYYKGTRYQTSYTFDHPTHTHTVQGQCTSSCPAGCNPNNHTTTVNCWDCEVATAKIIATSDPSQKLMSAEGKRILNSSSLNIPVNIEPDTPPPPPTKNLQIKLAGNVWEEGEDGSKADQLDGIKRGENDKVKKGVEVILHEQSGAEVKRTVTDKNGYYEFNDLNAQKKYYVQFVYDGQIYQATKYDQNITRIDGLNKTEWRNNGKELQNEREDFNNNFAQITSAPNNYEVRRPLSEYGIEYKNEGERNTAYIIEKESSETPYGIKEIYEYVIDQATENKDTGGYSVAYKNALKKFGNNDTTKSKLQFIEDCRISAYAGIWGDRPEAEGANGKYYPIWDNFTESTESRTIAGVSYPGIYPSHLNINFGLSKRVKFDMALRKDVQKATIEINGKQHTYTYDSRNTSDEDPNGAWDISVRLSDEYYNTKYSREIFASDYRYDVKDYYGENYADYGKSETDELEVYVTYKLTVRNQSQSVIGKITEIVDYFDEDYEYVDERSYITESNRNNAERKSVGYSYTSIYGSENSTNINGYKALYITGLKDIELTTGKTAYIYLTFRVNKNGEGRVLLDEKDWHWNEKGELECTPDGVGKENIAEINGFKTYYREGTYIPNVGRTPKSKVAGLFDRDSVPGNINPNDVPKDRDINYDNFEDDTDKAPNIRLILYKDKNGLFTRKADGIIWEDERTENEYKAMIGNGKYDNGEAQIKGVTVQLVELLDGGKETEKVWQEVSSGQGKYQPIININGVIKEIKDDTDGKYIFNSYPTGNFIVRFIYGDKESTTLTVNDGGRGQNEKSYNGQDYKSTTYQKDIKQDKIYTWREDSTWNLGQETLGKELTQIQTFKQDCSNNETAKAGNRKIDSNGNIILEPIPLKDQKGYLYDITESDGRAEVSDAKDIESRRNQVISYSDKNVTNYIAEVLRSHDAGYITMNERDTLINTLMEKTKMTAETGVMVIEVEYDRQSIDTKNDDEARIQGNYDITNLNLGLEERPKAQLSTNKKVTNIKLTLADGSTLFDATDKATNVLWRHHKEHDFKYYNEDLMLEKDPMVEVRSGNAYDAKYGLIQMSMDEELMHGATIKISYEVTITNKGEVDYKGNDFYYTGKLTENDGIVNTDEKIVKTEPNQVIDYVANNLQFYKADNNAWQVITGEELLNNGLVHKNLDSEIQKYNTIITTKPRNEDGSSESNIAKAKLVPEKYDKDNCSVTDELVLTQLITSENETDDLTYRNVVEIVKTSNDVGRRMAYSVVGNQNPNGDITEVDADRAEIVKILPPFGNAGIPYIIAGITLLASVILITGIIFIKKKVLK